MPIYEHHCNSCDLDWLEEYSMNDAPPTDCVECGSEDMYRCVTTSGAIHFKGAGWSPDGYSKDLAYEQLQREGKKVKLYDRREDLQREMKGEKAAATKARLKREDELAKKHFGPDAAMTQEKADARIKAAVDKVDA